MILNIVGNASLMRKQKKTHNAIKFNSISIYILHNKWNVLLIALSHKYIRKYLLHAIFYTLQQKHDTKYLVFKQNKYFYKFCLYNVISNNIKTLQINCILQRFYHIKMLILLYFVNYLHER